MSREPYSLSSHRQTTPTGPFFIDLFAGCGGLSLGLEEAGFSPIYVNELNPDALHTYIHNRQEYYGWLPDLSSNDVKHMLLEKNHIPRLKEKLHRNFGIRIGAGDLDLLVGGPPCQGFSGIGHRRSYAVEKEAIPSNYLYQDMAAIVDRLAPKLVLFENVRGLLSARWKDGGQKIWPDVQATFEEIRTKVDSKEYRYEFASTVVRASDYGVPQNRPRVLLVGVREDIAAGMEIGEDAHAAGLVPNGTSTYPNLSDILGDLIDPGYQPGDRVTETYPWRARTQVQRLLRKNREDSKVRRKGSRVSDHEYSKHTERVLKKFEYMQEHNGKVHHTMKTKKFAQKLLPREWGPSGPSITATSLPDDYVHFEQPRILTVREWARLQMFPDWYEFQGKRTTGGIRRAGNPREGLHDRELPKYTQIGNAVPVQLAKALGEHFKNELLRR